MPQESFFMAMGGIGISFAGFAGLISALDQRPESRSPIAAYRIRTIVLLGFFLMLVGVGTVVLYGALNHDLALTARVASAAIVAVHLRGLFDARPGPAWPVEMERRFVIAVLVALIAVTAGNVVVGSVEYLEVLLFAMLLGPASLFYNTIRDALAPASATPAAAADALVAPASATPAATPGAPAAPSVESEPTRRAPRRRPARG